MGINVGLVANDVVCRMVARFKIGAKRDRVSDEDGDDDDDDDGSSRRALSLQDPLKLASDDDDLSPINRR
eukprot:5755572-Pyramimonas_sp.AAC.1